MPATSEDAAVLRIGKWRVDPALDEISSEGRKVRLEPLAMRLLLCLARHAGRPVELQQLLDEVWTGVIVAQGSVYQAIAQLRRTLGDDAEHPTYIDTVPRKGYRLIAPVSPWVTGNTEPAMPGEQAARASEHPALDSRGPLSGAPSRWHATRRTRLLLAGVVGVVAVLLALTWHARTTLAPVDSATTSRPPDKSIAVLPFIDLSEKKDQEYFADGMAEEVMDILAKLPGLRVVGRTSSFQFRGKSVDVRSIGSALNVAYVLEGSVRRAGDQVRVTAQLISTQDGAYRWSEIYEAKFEDLFRVQDAIAANLARTLEVAVITMAAANRSTVDPATYEIFMQGRQAYDSWSQEGMHKAAALFNEVLRRDPKFPGAREALAWTYNVLGGEGWLPPSEAFGKAREVALRALQLDPNNAVAHAVLADVHLTYDWDWSAAEREIDTALRLGERDPQTLNVAARIAAAQGKWDQALQFAQEDLVKDPLDATVHMMVGAWIYQRMGRDSEAETYIRRALQIRPQWGTGRYFLAISLLMDGRLQEALHEAENELPQDGKFQAMSAVLYAMHRRSDSDAALQKAIQTNEADWPSSIAKLYAFRGEHDKAIAWLERAYQFHDEDLYYVKWDPQLRTLEGDPRYKAFLRKMNLPE